MSQKKQRQFLAMYEPVHDQFERFCRARVYGDMDFRDLINESLLTAYERFETLQSKDAFLSFLIGISVRLLANKHRKKKAIIGVDDDLLISWSDPSGNPEQAAEVYLLHKALAILSEEQREALILFEISGFSIKEVAGIQECSESAVKQRLRRGRARLTEILTFESAHKTG